MVSTGYGISDINSPPKGDFYIVAQNEVLAKTIQTVYELDKPAIVLAPVMFNDVVPKMDLGKAITLGWLENPLTKALDYNLRNKTYSAIMLRLFEAGWHKDGTPTWAGDYTRATAKLIADNLHVPVIIDCSARFLKEHGGDALYQLLNNSFTCQRNIDTQNDWIPGTRLFSHAENGVVYTSFFAKERLYSSIDFTPKDSPVVVDPPEVPVANTQIMDTINNLAGDIHNESLVYNQKLDAIYTLLKKHLKE